MARSFHRGIGTSSSVTTQSNKRLQRTGISVPLIDSLPLARLSPAAEAGVSPNENMANLPKEIIGEFIDAVVQDRKRADTLLSIHPELIDARWIHGESLIHFLAVEGFTDGVRFLAERGADVNTVNKFGDAPLIDIAVLGLDDAAEVLLRYGANPNASSLTRDNPLHCAVRSGNARLVSLLLGAGADGRYLTDIGESVFDALPESANERESIVTILGEYGITPRAG